MKHLLTVIFIIATVVPFTSVSAQKKSSTIKVNTDNPISEDPRNVMIYENKAGIIHNEQFIEYNPDSTIIFNDNAVSIYGFVKRKSEVKESFFVRNNTKFHISRIKLRLIYTSMKGEPLHTRDIIVECDITSGASQLLSVKSFDTQKRFYYKSSKSKSSTTGVPFNLFCNLLRYDIIVE